MLSLQFSSLHRKLLLSSPSSSLFSTSICRAKPETNERDGEITAFRPRRRHGSLRNYLSITTRAVENKDSQPQPQQQYEIDQDKAREALAKLDQQLDSLSKKQVPLPKVRASDVKMARDPVAAAEEDATELPGSLLAYSAGALLVLTILYNVFFFTVIKPSVDGPDYIPATPPLVSSEAPSTEGTDDGVFFSD
ncbi:hypothetical protein SAY87_001804 [Trapa incisa]|uniref:Transmembrane protein n=2 Tax=Trapa TaxID=22665 RepID=A0AAN7QDZ1_TRANT|nr:hypothetical protein SAY87_001804 [Trapa incisa]KAK4764791.1 hypothetical protein SAY86_025881 [Trapa natans]